MNDKVIGGRHFGIPASSFFIGGIAHLLDGWVREFFWIAVSFYALGAVSVVWIFVESYFDGSVRILDAKTKYAYELRRIERDGNSPTRGEHVPTEKPSTANQDKDVDPVEEAVDELQNEMRHYRSEWVSAEKVYLKVERYDGFVLTAEFPKVRGIKGYLRAYASRTVNNRPNSQAAMKGWVNMSRPKHEIIANGFEALGLIRKENPMQMNSKRVISEPVRENRALLEQIANGNFELLTDRWAG